MVKPPSLKALPHYPITVAVSLAAVAATLSWWSGWDIGQIEMTDAVWTRWELWRALTSTLPHVNVFHLIFNLYWFWTFGALFEREFGHVAFAAIIVLLALTSMLAEFALLEGGVGLSGVGYGLWGMLWALERRDPRFHGAIDKQTSMTFVFWFFLCIVLTVTNIMPVANIAHAVGAAVGVLIGDAVASRGATRLQNIAALVVVTCLSVMGATIFWPWVNLSPRAEAAVEHAAIEALEHSQTQQAIRYLELAARMRKAPARAWYNLGVAYQRAGRVSDAAAAWQRAADMPDATREMQQAASDFRRWRPATNGMPAK